eukprot:CAMPEP_0171066460 /NCGR_PEP_ID=MMETSP0766_2-20121228/7432_1 /TAXON_ID=439317 /ORGANISM="Gambierdiscus australes, Strain CAWD 149" /LENGTH=526 /DNA_ID=CAMNT_0011522635 /DNA_START=182 /DNA_END=1762 /DNA_ORIENTATION=-
MKDSKLKVLEALNARENDGTCLDMERVQLADGDGALATLTDVESASKCFEHCRLAPSCGQASFSESNGACNLTKEVSTSITHIGDHFKSTYCGDPSEVETLKGRRKKIQDSIVTRGAMGACEDLPGIQLSDAGGPADKLTFPEDVKATPKLCVEACRKDPGCKQVVFSKGNKGCYTFKEAADTATQSADIYYSAFCGQVLEAKDLKKKKEKIINQLAMRKARGICVDFDGIQVEDGTGFHEAIFSNQTNTFKSCVEHCRQRLGCEQAVFSEGNKGCYIFEVASNIKAFAVGSIYHAAYCGDLEQVKLIKQRAHEVKRQVEDRKDHGVCFESPGIRVADGKGGHLIKFPGNATREKCMEMCRSSVGCAQVVWSVKANQCYAFTEASTALFPGMIEWQSFHSAFCGSKADAEANKAKQQQVQKLAADRNKDGACIDLPGVKLMEPKGVNFYTWAGNATDCTEQCRTKLYCGQVLYTNHSCHMFQNQMIAFSVLGQQWHSARCTIWKLFSNLKDMQNQTIKLMQAKAAK